MDKSILAIVSDFSQWKGDTYRLAALVADAQREADKSKLAELGYTEASEAL